MYGLMILFFTDLFLEIVRKVKRRDIPNLGVAVTDVSYMSRYAIKRKSTVLEKSSVLHVQR